MSFIHVLGTIGKDIGKVALRLAPLVPGPAGVIAGGISAIVTQELTNAPGPEKKAGAAAVMNAVVPDHPNKAQIISQILEGMVQVFNAISELYPPPKQNP